MSQWSDLFINKVPLIDVRAPIEYAQGHLPNSINLPLMNDHERHLVGICYKEKGQAAAIELGHELVSGEVKKARVTLWIEFLQKNPDAQVMCLRGGLRSQISCRWISEAGIARTPIAGGYKKLRQLLLTQLESAPLPKMIRLGGMTGVGKTEALQMLKNFVDLEELAHHRGSTFGERGVQPSQASFESALAAQILGHESIIVEDESQRLGEIYIPQRFFQHMLESPLVILELSLDERAANIYRDYVLTHDHAFFKDGVNRISKKLGGLRTREILNLMESAFAQESSLEAHAEWIKMLLTEYYDPAYEYSLSKQQSKIVFRGSAREVKSFVFSINP